MGVSIRESIRINVALASAAAEAFNFGALCGVFEHSATSNRFDGPYRSIDDLEDAGFTSDDEPNVHGWATSVFAQNPHVELVFVGRQDAGDADMTETLEAIDEEAGEDGWYITNIESRAKADILLAAAFIETKQKILMVQTSDDLVAQVTTITFAGAGAAGAYSVTVEHGDTEETVTYTGPGSETNTQVATAFFNAWNADDEATAIATATNPSAGVVVLTFVNAGEEWDVSTSPVAGTMTPVESTAASGDVFDQLNLGAYTRTAADLHAFDDAADGTADGLGPQDGYLDGAWCGRCGGFNLDAPEGAGAWRYKRLAGITPDSPSSADAARIFATKGNIYARIKGLSFPQKGTMASGRRIDVTTSMDWFKVRSEERILSLFVGAPNKIPFTEAGINQMRAAQQDVLDRGVTNGHISPDHPRVITMPKVTTISAADKAAGILTYTVRFTLAGSLEEVEVEVSVEE